MRKQINAAEQKMLDILHRTEAMAAAPSDRSTKAGNLNRLKDGIFSSRLLTAREREIFYDLIGRLTHDYPPTTVVDQSEIELVALLFIQIGRALAANDIPAIKKLDTMLRGHLRLLNATKLAREGHQPLSPIGTPDAWAQYLLDVTKDKLAVEPQDACGSQPTDTCIVPYSLDNPGTF